MRDGQEMASFVIADADDVRLADECIDRLVSYMESKTAGQRLPCRADVNPADFKELLPDICFFEPIYEIDGSLADVIVRLEGTRAAAFYGEHTNKSVHEHPSPEVAACITASVEAALASKRPVVAEAQSLSPDQSFLSVKATYIPMSENNDRIDRLLVLIQVRGRPI